MESFIHTVFAAIGNALAVTINWIALAWRTVADAIPTQVVTAEAAAILVVLALMLILYLIRGRKIGVRFRSIMWPIVIAVVAWLAATYVSAIGVKAQGGLFADQLFRIGLTVAFVWAVIVTLRMFFAKSRS